MGTRSSAITSQVVGDGEYAGRALGYVYDPVLLDFVVQTPSLGVGGGGPATIADGADITQGAKADLAWDGVAAAPSAQGILKYLGSKLEAIRALLAGSIAVTGTFWQATQPVSGAFFQATQPVSAVALPLPAGAAQDGTDIAAPAPAMPAGGVGIRGWLSAIWTKLNGTLVVSQATPANLQTIANAGTNLNTSALALEAGGNLAAIAAKDFSTSAKQDTEATLLTLIDTDLKAELGAVAPAPGAYTVLDRLNVLGSKIDAHAKIGATEATMQKMLVALSRPVPRAYSTLLHR